MVYEGVLGGSIETDASGILIRRKGVLSVLSHGLKGDKRIPYASISAVQMKLGSWAANGYIQFTLSGGIESRGGVIAAVSDENSVMFTRAQNSRFLAARADIEQAMLAARQPVASHAPAAPWSLAEDVLKLATLHERGLLTDAEFLEQKSRILARPA